MRDYRQVISIYLVYLIPFSLCESDCFSQVISSENGCTTYMASSAHPGRPCRLMEKTVPPLTFFLKPQDDFKFMTARVIRARTRYDRVQYGSLKIRRRDLKQGGGWNEIVLRHMRTSNFQGVSWLSYFLDINGQRKDISDDQQHTDAATNFQIIINGSVQWRGGCGRRLNIPFLEPIRTTIKSTVNVAGKITGQTTMLPTELHAATIPMSMATSSENTSSTMISKSPEIIVRTNLIVPTIIHQLEITTSAPIDKIPTAMADEATEYLNMSTSITDPSITKSELDMQTISTSKSTKNPSSESTIQEGTTSTNPPITIHTTSTETQQTKLVSKSRFTTAMPTSLRHTAPTLIPTTIMPTKFPIKTRAKTPTEEKSIEKPTTIMPNKFPIKTIAITSTEEKSTESSVIIVTNKEVKEHTHSSTSKPTQSITSKMVPSEMQNITSTRSFTESIDEKYNTSTEYPTIIKKVTAFPDSVTELSSSIITKIMSTIQSESNSKPTFEDMTTYPGKIDRHVTSTLPISDTTVTSTNRPRKPRLNNNSSSEKTTLNQPFSSNALDSNLPLPLWQMIALALLIDITIVILALCVFMIVHSCKKKRESKRLLAEIDHVTFSQYIKKNIQPNSTEADAESLYGGQIGPGVDSEMDEIDPDVFEKYIKRNLQPNQSGADAATLYGRSSRIVQRSDSNLESHRTQNEDRS